MKKVNLNSIIEAALDEALAALAARARDMVFEAAQAALEAKVKALLGEATPEAPVRARAKATATPTITTPEAPEAAAEAKAPRRKAPRRKAKAARDATLDLATLMEGVGAALKKYEGVSTPRGKPLPQVLARRVRKVLEHAQALGRDDLPVLARSALAYIHADPRGTAMASWQALAAKLGLPIPVAQAE